MGFIRTAFAAAMLVAGLATAALAEDLEGTYEVHGVNPDGSTYSGTAEIIATSETTCRIIWSVGTESSGICMRNGIAFAAGYVLRDKVGLVIYKIRQDGSLDGTWTVADEDGAGTEMLIPQ